MNSFVQFVKSCEEQFYVCRNNETQRANKMLKRAGYLFNLPFCNFQEQIFLLNSHQKIKDLLFRHFMTSVMLFFSVAYFSAINKHFDLNSNSCVTSFIAI